MIEELRDHKEKKEAESREKEERLVEREKKKADKNAANAIKKVKGRGKGKKMASEDPFVIDKGKACFLMFILDKCFK